jgi:uncharacterized protein
MTAATIIVIAKSPVAGRVKTRLCPPCTPAEAAHIAAAALADTLAVVAETPATAHVLALDGRPGPWVPDGFVIVPQVSVEQLVSAGEVLNRPQFDAVIAPARDGGWWAIGLRRADPRVFVGVPMSTADTCRDQLARLDLLGYRTAILDTLRDVDTFADVVDVARTVPGSRFAAAVTDLGYAETAAG